MSVATATRTRAPNPVGHSIPAYSVHGISVSLPTWRDNIKYEEGDIGVIEKIKSAYPRFKIHYLIEKLEAHCERKFGTLNEKCHLYPSQRLAELCREYMHAHSPESRRPVDIRIVQFRIHPPEVLSSQSSDRSQQSINRPSVELYIVFFPLEHDPLARSFWQHTGTGISSRLAEYCLALLSPSDLAKSAPLDISPSSRPVSPTGSRPRHRHYSSLQRSSIAGPKSPTTPSHEAEGENEGSSPDWSRYLEERYARNLPVCEASSAKRQLRRRIAGVLIKESPQAQDESVVSLRGPTEDDVFLFPSGMSAIWHTHRAILEAFSPSKSACFGFPYTDTLKILQKWGPGCYFFGHGLESEMDDLVSALEESRAAGSPVHALWCEFPSNPLLRSPPLVKLRALAEKYGFVIIVDETIGSFANVEVLPLADVIVSSLSKVFSGETNVLGGSLVLNPQGKHYDTLKRSLAIVYEDNYWVEDAVFMERNSRDFAPRVKKMNRNTEILCESLRSRSVAGLSAPDADSNGLVIKDVYYPKWVTHENYEECRIGSKKQLSRSAARSGGTHTKEDVPEGGYGMLFTLTFTSEYASEVFYDALATEKGPSLGTNFTLASPYAILAHYNELEWAAKYGVEKGLVRVSVGLEDENELLSWFREALGKAEQAIQSLHANGDA